MSSFGQKNGTGEDAFTVMDQGLQDAMATQNSGMCIPIPDEEMQSIQFKMTQCAEAVRRNKPGASEQEIITEIINSSGNLGLPPTLGAAQINQMCEKAATDTRTKPLDIPSGQSAGLGEDQGQEQSFMATMMAFITGAKSLFGLGQDDATQVAELKQEYPVVSYPREITVPTERDISQSLILANAAAPQRVRTQEAGVAV